VVIVRLQLLAHAHRHGVIGEIYLVAGLCC